MKDMTRAEMERVVAVRLMEDVVDEELGLVRVDGHRAGKMDVTGMHGAMELYHQTCKRHGEVFFLHGSIERVLRGIMRRAGPEEILTTRAM